MAYPWSSGNILTAADLDAAFVQAGLGQLCVSTTTGFTIPTGVGSSTPITFGTDVTDGNGWHSTSSQTDRFIPGVVGYYEVQCNVTFTNNLAAGDRVSLAILVNGAGVSQARTDIAAASASILTPTVPVSGIVSVAIVTDYISVAGLHSNASGRNVDARISVKRVG